MAVRQIAVSKFIHECSILEDSSATADAYGHNATFNSSTKAAGIGCRYYEEANTEKLGALQGQITVSKLLLPAGQSVNAEDKISSIVHKGRGTSLVSGTFEILSILTRPTHKIATLRKVAQN